MLLTNALLTMFLRVKWKQLIIIACFFVIFLVHTLMLTDSKCHYAV